MTLVPLRDGIAAQLVGREREAAIIVLALIAREHVLFVGPPGTAKSQMCRGAASLIEGATYFERLLTPTTAPEAVWGPVSISALREDRYQHITKGYAPDAHILYLDEIGRASAAILDSLLHLLGPERQALIGTEQVKVPLVAAIASANTWPEDAAMLDRWTLRASVQYLPAGMRRDLLAFVAPQSKPVATLADLESAHVAIKAIKWSATAIATLDQILGDLDEAGIAVSDRRLRTSEKIARSAALLRDGSTASEVLPIDLEVLQWVLWSVPDQAALATQKIVGRANPVGARLDTMLAEVDELVRAAVDAPTRIDAKVKIETVLNEAMELAAKPGANGRAAKVVKYIREQATRVTGAILNMSAERIERLVNDI